MKFLFRHFPNRVSRFCGLDLFSVCTFFINQNYYLSARDRDVEEVGVTVTLPFMQGMTVFRR